MSKNVAYISLGTNIGKRENYLHLAISELQSNNNINVKRTSSIYETDPVGYTEQASFLNMVVEIETTYLPEQLIKTTMAIEETLGRKRDIHWGPRTIDLDILLYNEENIESEQLIVPHPRMNERAFVLIPLLEIVTDLTVKGHSLQGVLQRLHDKEGVRLWKRRISEEEFVHLES
jgi:2-amino-4-hydroxy-6-hydroxymethyldihydropteridine diphosphokinase